MQNGLVSVIVTTYNWPAALKLVLLSLDRQSDRAFEVIVADDGSREDTRDMIDELSKDLGFPLQHVWQEDLGFRAARCRNQAVLAASGGYLVFLDGDCIVREDFVHQHRRLASRSKFVRGNRVKLARNYTEYLLGIGKIDELHDARRLLANRLRGNVGRLLPLARLPLGPVRDLRTRAWKGAKTCNLAMSRSDFEAVNGFNEAFEGWGHEDADLVIRLIRNGTCRREGSFATTVFHCFHDEQDRMNEARNRLMLEQSFKGALRPERGLYPTGNDGY